MVAKRIFGSLAAFAVVAVLALSGGERRSEHPSLGKPVGLGWDQGWLSRARPLSDAPPWAGRMYLRSLLVLRALTDRRTGAAIAGAREGWEYVWPRDASATAMAFASAGYLAEARRVVRFLSGLRLDEAARFYPDGTPVEGREAQGDAAGWVAVAARAVGLRYAGSSLPWRDRADYQEGEAGDYIGNAVAATTAELRGLPAGAPAVRRPAEEEIRKAFGAADVLVRDGDDPDSGLDSAAAWAVRPFRLRGLYPAARRTLRDVAADSSRFGIVPSEHWGGADDPWTAPTAWTAWSLAALGERREALRLMTALHRDATPASLLPERVDARTGLPTSTTPLAWSHAFAILALRQLWH